VEEIPEYDEFVKANYQQPASYVRSNKKLGEEFDVTVDYICEPDDKVSFAFARHPANVTARLGMAIQAS
jgi:hypothetical protein